MPTPLISISHRQALLFAIALVLYEFLTYIANDMIMPGMIHVVNSFNAPSSAVATSLTVYMLGGASLQLFLGPLSDWYGRRPVMLTGACVFFIFTLAIAGSHSIHQFLLARYFQGFGLCFIGVIGYATLQEIFSEMDAIRWISVMSTVASTAPLLGPLAGAAFIFYFDWRILFLTIAFFALIALVGLWYYMPESVGQLKKDGARIERTPLKFGVILKNYMTLCTHRRFMLSTLLAGVLSVPCITWIALSPVIIVKDAQQSVLTYALWQLPLFLSLMLGNWMLRLFTRHYRIEQMIAIGSIITASGLVLCWFLTAILPFHFQWLVPGLVIYGFGLGIASAPLSRLTLFLTPISKGTASALMSMVSMVVQALGVEAGNIIYNPLHPQYFGLYFACSAGLILIGGFWITDTEAKA